MPHIDINFLNKLNDNYNNYHFFIESGTYLGETIFQMENYFNKLITIEIDDTLHYNIKELYNDNKIMFLLGDSSKIFEHILPDIKDNTIFFLDGHWSAGNTGKGDKDCPLIEEITNINVHFKNKGIIIINDVRLFGKGPNNTPDELCNWEDISSDKIINILSERITDQYYINSSICENDRLIIHIKEI